jgi:hypothetical protein
MEKVKRIRNGVTPVALAIGIAMVVFAATQSVKSQPPRKQASFEQALQILSQASQAYQGIQDYTCTFVKQEVVNGKLLPENIKAMKVRSQPFSVYFKWQAPKSLEGQECCFVAGRNNNLMRVHSAGVLGAIGFVNIEMNDSRVLASSRHPITEAGIGSLIERLAKRWPEEQTRQRTQVLIGEYEFARRRCTRVETVNPNTRPGEFYCYRSVIYFDQQTKLPIRAEAFGWPNDKHPEGERFEVYSYLDLKFNVGLRDADFNY